MSGVLAQLHSKAALLLAEEALPAAPPDGDGVLGSGLLAMNRVATVVGSALDSFVVARNRNQFAGFLFVFCYSGGGGG